jgi:hypothetical protein
MIKKRSYYNSSPEKKKSAKDGDLPIAGRENDTSAEGAAGFNLLEMGIEGFGQDSDNYESAHRKDTTEDKSVGNVIDLLVDLGNIADASDNEAFANFADYLLVKYAETKTDSDPALLYNQLMIKIKNANLPDTNEVLKKLTKIYSRTILLEHSQHGDLNKAKQSAYKKIVHRADQYMTEM